MVKDLVTQDFNEAIASGVVLVDFWAPWCGPCKMIGPVVEELSNELGDKVNFYKVNVDNNIEVAQQYKIASIPTLLIFKDGELANTLIGFRPKDGIKAELEKLI